MDRDSGVCMFRRVCTQCVMIADWILLCLLWTYNDLTREHSNTQTFNTQNTSHARHVRILMTAARVRCIYTLYICPHLPHRIHISNRPARPAPLFRNGDNFKVYIFIREHETACFLCGSNRLGAAHIWFCFIRRTCFLCVGFMFVLLCCIETRSTCPRCKTGRFAYTHTQNSTREIFKNNGKWRVDRNWCSWIENGLNVHSEELYNGVQGGRPGLGAFKVGALENRTHCNYGDRRKNVCFPISIRHSKIQKH